jgi:uncharacterized membrane protein
MAEARTPNRRAAASMGTNGAAAGSAPRGLNDRVEGHGASVSSTDRAAPGRSRLRQLRAAPRGLIAAGGGLIAAGCLAAICPWEATVLLGWDTGLALFLSLVWFAVASMDQVQTADHAAREDSSQAAAGSVVVGAAIASLGAVCLILLKAANERGGGKAFIIGVGVLSVLLSWAALHTVFTLRYARMYYTGAHGGVDFNERTPPDYVDFGYLAFTIGMTFQVSDTNLTSKAIRRTALRHALVSYLFGAMIIGLVINVVASLLH